MLGKGGTFVYLDVVSGGFWIAQQRNFSFTRYIDYVYIYRKKNTRIYWHVCLGVHIAIDWERKLCSRHSAAGSFCSPNEVEGKVRWKRRLFCREAFRMPFPLPLPFASRFPPLWTRVNVWKGCRYAGGGKVNRGNRAKRALAWKPSAGPIEH